MNTKMAVKSPPSSFQKNMFQKIFFSSKVAPYVFVMPFILSFAIFFAYPVITTIIMSFQQVLPGDTHFIGLENYHRLDNTHFYRAMFNSSVYTILTLIILIPLPLVLAVFLNAKKMLFKNFFRSTLFVPALASVVVSGTIFRLVFGELPGSLMNILIGLFGHAPIQWMMNPATAMFAMVMLATWRWTGVNIIYFLSGLQSIPHELYESASIDGANTLQKFFKITMPLLKPVTIYVLTISIYGGYAMFTESYMLYNGNGSPNDMGLTIVGYIYKTGLEQNNLGFGSAVGITLLAITLLLN
ncbi:MAG: arabinose transporter permease, partial [Paenibacillus sp. RIFOXYA1_FULL_44_5]